MALTGKQKRALDEALRDAFRTRIALARMLAHQCDHNLDDIAGVGGLRAVVFELVEAADAEGWADGLLTGALAENPGNASLRTLYDSAWPAIAAQFPSRSTLQSLVEASKQFLDVDQWLNALQQMSARVCQVETTAGVALGSGFLVGPSCVITNYHVLEDVLGEANLPVVCRFDFRLRPDGSQRKGVTFCPKKASKWLVASSPYSLHDFQIAPSGTPGRDQLDYVIVRLADDPGAERGWIDISAVQQVALAPGQPLSILQHPSAQPLKLALDTYAVIGINANQTRLLYRTNTEHGSSGSPCFTMDWEPVAIHHAGDPAEPKFPATRNAGVPLPAIRAHLEDIGQADCLVI